MQGHIINMFPPAFSEDLFPHTSSGQSWYTFYHPRLTPALLQPDSAERSSIMKGLLDEMIEHVIIEFHLLNREHRPFMKKFEQILRIFYRYNRFNPELILLYQDLLLDDGSQSDEKVGASIEKMKSQVLNLLKEQANEDGILEEGSCMEKLILFSMGEIIKIYQVELMSYCRELIDSHFESGFPKEEEMVERFYTPIAEHLKGLVAS